MLKKTTGRIKLSASAPRSRRKETIAVRTTAAINRATPFPSSAEKPIRDLACGWKRRAVQVQLLLKLRAEQQPRRGARWRTAPCRPQRARRARTPRRRCVRLHLDSAPGPDSACRKWCARVGVRAERYDFAMIDNRDPVAEALRLFHVVRRVDE